MPWTDGKNLQITCIKIYIQKHVLNSDEVDKFYSIYIYKTIVSIFTVIQSYRYLYRYVMFHIFSDKEYKDQLILSVSNNNNNNKNNSEIKSLP